MASIRKRGNSYLLVVSMGYTPDGRRRNPQQKTIKPPAGLTPKQTEKWLQEQAMLFEMSCKNLNPDIDRSITLEKYTEIWLQTIAPDKLAKSRSCAKSRTLNASNRTSAATSWSIFDRNTSAVCTRNCGNRKIKRQESRSPKRR